MTYMLLLNCALKLVEEIILYYDARLKKHQIPSVCYIMIVIIVEKVINTYEVCDYEGEMQPASEEEEWRTEHRNLHATVVSCRIKHS